MNFSLSYESFLTVLFFVKLGKQLSLAFVRFSIIWIIFFPQ